MKDTTKKSLDECKDEVARKKYGYKDFAELLTEQDLTAWNNCELFNKQAAELYASQFVKKDEAVNGDVVEEFKRFVKFLCGETDFDGSWFGEFRGTTQFWWRTKLREFENILQSTQQPSMPWLTDSALQEMFKNFDAGYSIGAQMLQDKLKERVNCVDPVELLQWLTDEDSPYVILYGDEKRFCTNEIEGLSSEELLEIYLTPKTKDNG